MFHVILGLLLSEPLSLYDVRKRFTSGISLFYSSSSGSIERALRGLVDEGLATISDAEDSRRRKKLYSITAAGRQAWRAWMVADIPASSESEKVVLAKVFLAGRVENRRERLAVLDAARARVSADLEALEELDGTVRAMSSGLPAGAALTLRYQHATLTHGIRGHAQTLEWINDLRSKENE